MSDEISVSGLEQALTQLGALGTKLDSALKYGIDAIALAVQRTAQNGLTSVQNNTGKGHIGGAGGFPNRRTGALAGSVRTESTRKGFGEYEATVQPGMIYARRLETGAGWSVNYPYMRPSADYVRKQAESIFLSAVRSRWK
jgi:L,D-peptidoglycan transpeptidase YkuD (ErfK/YbiS/YcfS/YnhG family)